MKEAECRNVERNYRVAASKQAELQLIAAPAPHSLTTASPPAPPQSDRERANHRDATGRNLIEYLQYLIVADY